MATWWKRQVWELRLASANGPRTSRLRCWWEGAMKREEERPQCRGEGREYGGVGELSVSTKGLLGSPFPRVRPDFCQARWRRNVW